ncbi:hypothetical protein L1987_50088 [Smallanthus sonchifolius]|uniref:Uncharacterized protein n=1 Tax=Smallanthus sonchifolius TaxID=185202 RepID=A0ACB9FVU0_9ASTR|nr:hypothetical protein L1987_50088 [Smallanthus sonchifolius]
MPQESLRSVVYRSFVTCEDPRGVVEGKTIRISKTNPTKMSTRIPEKETQSKNSKQKEKMSLVEVKNGAQNLNKAIDSWSKGVSFKSQPKDIVKDLLKGALDLQESLMMLGKLQEASCMTNFKKKQEKPSKELFSRIGSDRFESFQIYDSCYQKERKLANGSSRDCFTELREAIKEGLSKQNLLIPNKSDQESVFSSTHIEGLAGVVLYLQCRRKLQSSPDIASTSSSTSSSMVYSTHEFTSSESFSSRATEEKSKGSNLIAKLMGLEEFPAKPARKQLDISSKMRPVFNVNLPNVKKPQSFVQKSDQERMSLDEIIKMMQSKGLLRSSKREIKQNSKRVEDDERPIVLMRPQRIGLYSDDQKVEVYENPIRKLHQEKAKAEYKSVKNRGMMKSKLDSPSNKQKASVPAATKPQRKQEVEKKIDKIQKTASPIKKKSVENAKSINSISKNSSLKPQRSALPNQVSKQTYSSALSTNKSHNQKKNTKTEKPIIIHEVLQIDSPSQEETKDSEVKIKEIGNVRQTSLCEAFEKDSYRVRDATMRTDQFETRNNQEANGVSDINEQKERILKTIRIFQDPEPASFELFQDCIYEFLEHEKQRQNPLIPRSILPSRACISEDQMMRGVLKKFENLKYYSKFSNETFNADTVSGLLERDLNLSTIGGAWSTTGWKDGCTVNEVEETVLHLEKMVLSRLIDDVLMELV